MTSAGGAILGENAACLEQFVLPKSQHTPAGLVQLAVHHPVSRPIPCDLVIPIPLIGVWTAIALRATVPEATIHKHGNALVSENKIRFADKHLPPPPALNARIAKDGYQPQIVSPRHEIGPSLRPFHPAIAAAPQPTHRFHPAKDFFHPFANALTGAVTGATGRASVQTLNLGSLFARRVRRDFPLPAPG